MSNNTATIEQVAKRPLRVLHVMSSLGRGGRERQLAYILKYSDPSVVISKALVFRPKDPDNSYIDEYDINDKILGYMGNQYGVRWWKKYRKAIRDWKPDIVWTWGYVEAAATILACPGLKFIHVVGSIRGTADQHRHSPYILLRNKLSFKLSNYTLGNSRYGLKSFNVKNGYVLYNGIDEDFLQLAPEEEKVKLRASLGIKKGEYTCIFIGNFRPVKDHATIIRAIQRIPKSIPFKMLFIGDGPTKADMENLAKSLHADDRIIFLGREMNVKKYLSISDIYIHSSQSEGLSNSILEAMAQDLPVIASDTGGTSEIVSEDNGRLYSYQDSEALSNAIIELLADEQLRERKSKASKLIIKNNFTIDIMIGNYEKLAKRFANDKR